MSFKAVNSIRIFAVQVFMRFETSFPIIFNLHWNTLVYDFEYYTFFKFLGTTGLYWSRDSSVGITTGYGLDDRGVGVRVPVGSRIFSYPCRPDRLWPPPNLLSNGYRRLFPLG
jgi:hypothetical protein